MAVGTRMQQRRAVEAEWNTSNYILSSGELGVTTDTGIIKIGDGVNGWSDLDPAFDSQYLPILGKAADSELLDGIGSESFAKVEDVPTLEQMANAVIEARRIVFSRQVVADFTLQTTDAGNMIIGSNTNWTPDIIGTIPTNATVPIPVGAIVDIASVNKGSVKLVPAGGVILRGNGVVYGGNAVTRFVKTATDEWLVLSRVMSAPAMVKQFVTAGFSIPHAGSYTALPLAGSDAAVDTPSKRLDSLGSGIQWDAATPDRLICRRDGYYDIIGQWHVVAATAGRGFAAIYVNGVAQHVGRGYYLGLASTGAGVVANLPLRVNDYVQLYAYQDTTAARAVNNESAAASFLQWKWAAPL